MGTSDWPAVQHFRSQGYLRLPTALPTSRVDALSDVVDREFADARGPFRTNSASEIARLDDLLSRDAVFIDTLREPAILRSLKALLGPNIEVSRHRHNHATLNRANDIPFRLHRDIQQWSRSLVSVFIYLDEATLDNGCTHLVPGSHLLPHAGPQSADGAGVWADEYPEYEVAASQVLPVPMPSGGVLLLDSLTFHTAGVNRTTSTRRSVAFACHSADALTEHPDRTSYELLIGERRFRGNAALEVSGSLTNPAYSG